MLLRGRHPGPEVFKVLQIGQIAVGMARAPLDHELSLLPENRSSTIVNTIMNTIIQQTSTIVNTIIQWYQQYNAVSGINSQHYSLT